MNKFLFIAFCVMTFLLPMSAYSFAQTSATPSATPSAASPPASPAAKPEEPVAPVIRYDRFNESLLFSPLEILLIRKFLEDGGSVNADSFNVQEAPYIPPIRRIILSGIVYRGPEDWIVWLNNEKLTPGNLLPEVVSMQVKQDRIDLEWYDIGLNDVIKINLRPHQIYDIVTGVLLPG